jgi:2-polyprenyl-3-methyl-5-hydroxy-6-metoxy-1,4-benzoquinol methylase
MNASTTEVAGTAAGMRACPVCGGGDFRPMFRHRRRAGEQRRAPYRITQSTRALVGAITRCADCGLGALPPALVDAGHYADGADAVFAEQASVRIRNAERLLRLLPPPAPGTPLLDVGSAYGFLLVAARQLGYAPVGVEPSQEAAEQARRTYGLEICGSTVEQARLAAGGFEVITLADVIEHLSDPAAVLPQLHRLLRPGGRLVILTPDLGSVMARCLGRHWWALLDDHYFYFSRRTLPRFLARHGFATEHVHAFGRSFPLRHWAFKLSQYSPRLQRTVGGLLGALRLADVEVPLNFGDQMACVARKAAGTRVEDA